MKVKNAHLLASVDFLGKINSDDQEISFAFKVSTIINRVNMVIKPLSELRQKLVDEATVKGEDGKPIFLDPSRKYISLTTEGAKKLDELMELETDVEIVDVFSLAELKAAGVKLKPSLVEAVKWLIK